MPFKPLGDRVLVEPAAAETKTKGGIIIPDTAGEKPTRGKVIAVGPGARAEDGRLLPLDVKKGDTVLYGKWSGTEVKMDGKEYVILKESDILGVEG
jgi:chaperonin GroES